MQAQVRDHFHYNRLVENIQQTQHDIHFNVVPQLCSITFHKIFTGNGTLILLKRLYQGWSFVCILMLHNTCSGSHRPRPLTLWICIIPHYSITPLWILPKKNESQTDAFKLPVSSSNRSHRYTQINHQRRKIPDLPSWHCPHLHFLSVINQKYERSNNMKTSCPWCWYRTCLWVLQTQTQTSAAANPHLSLSESI